MSMTPEEAIEILSALRPGCGPKPLYTEDEKCEAFDLAISALRPVSRERAEKVFSGCDFCKIELDDYPYIIAHSDYSSSDTCYEPGFCPICWKPLTDEAVQMVMERMEALHGET